MINGLNCTRLNFSIALRGNLNTLWIDVAIASHAGIANQTFPRQHCEMLTFSGRESKYLILKLNIRAHDLKYSALEWWGVTPELSARIQDWI